MKEKDLKYMIGLKQHCILTSTDPKEIEELKREVLDLQAELKLCSQ